MPEDELNIWEPSPDDGHEAILAGVRKAITDLAATIETVDYNTDDVGLSLDMADTLFVLIDSLMATNAELAERVAVLETPPEPEPEPEPEPNEPPADEAPDVPPTDPTVEVAP